MQIRSQSLFIASILYDIPTLPALEADKPFEI